LPHLQNLAVYTGVALDELEAGLAAPGGAGQRPKKAAPAKAARQVARGKKKRARKKASGARPGKAGGASGARKKRAGAGTTPAS